MAPPLFAEQYGTGVFAGRAEKGFPPLPREHLINLSLRNALIQAADAGDLNPNDVSAFLEKVESPRKKGPKKKEEDEKSEIEKQVDALRVKPISLVESYRIRRETNQALSLDVKIDLAQLRKVILQKKVEKNILISDQGSEKQKLAVALRVSSQEGNLDLPSVYLRMLEAKIEKHLSNEKFKNIVINDENSNFILDIQVILEKKELPQRLTTAYRSLWQIEFRDKKGSLLAREMAEGPFVDGQAVSAQKRSLLATFDKMQNQWAPFFKKAKNESLNSLKSNEWYVIQLERAPGFSVLSQFKTALGDRLNDGSEVLYHEMGQGRASLRVRTNLKEDALVRKIQELASAGIPLQVYEIGEGVIRTRYVAQSEY